MNSPAANRASPPSTSATSGGTPSTLLQHVSHDDQLHFLHEQSPRELVRAISSEYSATVLPKDIEQPRSAIDSSSLSSRSSSSSSALQHQNASLSFGSRQSLSESFSHMNFESPVVPPEQALLKPRSRMRELSAPLPSVPPSTPASAISHRSSFSQTQPHHPAISPSFLRHGSPIFSSPLTELSDSEEIEQDMAELSDSNSVEIISGYVAHPFVPGRKDIENNSQNISQSSRPSYSVIPSRPTASPNSNGNTNSKAQQMADLSLSTHVAMSTSQTPTPHPLSRSFSSVHAADNEDKSTTVKMDSCFVSSLSKPMTPPRGQHRRRTSDGRLSSGTSSPEGAHVQTVENPSHESHGAPEVTPAQEINDSLRTPNVYINGLPPHFPDESLYLMTRDFGNVLSVRTFTRCVGEKMSGYGFVLFESVESAERCIETLRKYRNLHPSFSKQVHKIPGTPYASGTITLPPSGSLPSLTSQSTLSTMSSLPSMGSNVSCTTSSSMKDLSSPAIKYDHRNHESISTTSDSEFSGNDLKDLSFREKMEKLRDDRSTNLYMEGLPLTIDDVSLSALMSPHKVVSSRFFQTKLSNPPRMIAFVRLDTRPGAEEIIERLHGRVVRGWNDNGCRISVRFADTNEQRELRRSERSNRGEEEVTSAPQLSMAHAALLNLRGAEAQAQLGNVKFHQHMHLANYDHRPAVSLPNPQLANVIHSGSELGSRDSFLRLSGTQNVHRGLGTYSTVHQQHHPHVLAAPHQPQPTSTHVSTSAVNLLDSRSAFAERAVILKKNAFSNAHRPLDGFSANSLDSSQLALLQQQNQLQQLELFRQIQNAGIDPTYALENHNLGQAYSLMPSANISTNEFAGPNSQVSMGHLQGTHGQQKSLSHCRQLSRPYGKGAMSEFSASSQPRTNNDEHYPGHHSAGDQASRHMQQQYSANQSPASPGSGYPANFMRPGAEHQEGLINSSSHRRGTALEEGEVTLISPALTYASRTPSTLSPATPLFNTFGTPASAPATVPRGKMSVREREYARLYRNEIR